MDVEGLAEEVAADDADAAAEDVDTAVAAAHKAFETTWGLNVSGAQRGKILSKIADLIEERQNELSAVEALDNGE